LVKEGEKLEKERKKIGLLRKGRSGV